MTLTIKVREENGVRVLRLAGRLILGKPADELHDTMQRLVAEGARLFVLNLARVSYMDSSGLGQVVSAYTTVTRKGGRIVLVSPSPRTEQLLQVAKLVTVFDVFGSEAEAVGALTEKAALNA
jgi:anti-sigma B factor antagonist